LEIPIVYFGGKASKAFLPSAFIYRLFGVRPQLYFALPFPSSAVLDFVRRHPPVRGGIFVAARF
jgi:hypothetical protein